MSDQPKITSAKQQALAAQMQAADPNFTIFVSANAGSGKTHVLINRVIRLLLADAAPDQILCLTYTKAAASEMLNRLFARLGDFSVLPNEQLLEELEKLQPDVQFQKDDLAKARRLFARALETPGGLKIRTIHGFCETLLRQFPLEASVSPAFRLVEGQELSELQTSVMDRIKEQAFAGTHPEYANAMQVLMQSGVSSVDTCFDMARQNAGNLQQLHDPDILAAELDKTRVKLGLEEGASRDSIDQQLINVISLQTIKDIAGALQKSSKTHQNMALKLLSIVAQTERQESGQSALDLFVEVFLTADFEPRKISMRKDLQSVFAQIEPYLLEAQEKTLASLQQYFALQCWQLTCASLVLGSAFASKYTQEKNRLGWLDFDDLIEHVRKLLGNRALADWVLYKLDGRLAHVLVDEAQDNSPAHWDVIGALVSDFFAGVSAAEQNRTMFAVGDPKQSIYRFQGAEPALFAQTSEQIKSRVTDTDIRFDTPQMSLSWRSTKEVLGFVDACFANLDHKFQGEEQDYVKERVPEAVNGRKPVSMQEQENQPPGFEDYMQHGIEREGQRGSVTIVPPVYRQKTDIVEAPHTPVQAAEIDQHQVVLLAGKIASDIQNMIERKTAVHERVSGSWQPRAAGFGDVLVLVRSRGDLFVEVIRQLKLARIPVAGADRMKLQSELAVLDLLSTARFAMQPQDDLSLAEILRGPLLHPEQVDASPVSEQALMDLATSRPQKESLYRALANAASGASAAGNAALWREVKKWLDELIRRASHETPYQFFSGILNRRSPSGESYLRRMFARLGNECADPVEEFLRLALQAGKEQAGSLPGFVTAMSVRNDEIKRELEEAKNAVRVMTIHGAKGLESPIVILPQTNMDPTGKAQTMLTKVDDCWLWARTNPRKKSKACKLEREFRDLETKLEQEESQRLLYVALTRAQDHLLIYAHEHGKSNDKIIENSWYDICHQAMKTLDNSMGKSSNAEKKEAKEAEEDEEGANWPGGHYGTQVSFNDLPDPGVAVSGSPSEVTLPDWAMDTFHDEPGTANLRAPSHLEDTANARSLVNSPTGRVSEVRFRRGNLIHALLESLPELPVEERAAAAEQYLRQQTDLEDHQRVEITKAVFAVLEHPEFSSLFGANSRAELPVTGQLPNQEMLIGKIDRLVVSESQVLVVDFKSNRPPPKTVDDIASAYVTQMNAYRALLKQIWPDKQIKCALLWTDGPSLMEVPE